MSRVWLSLGSNINREANLLSGIAALNLQYGQLVISPVYESDAVGFDGGAFFNLVVGIDTSLGLTKLAEQLRKIEEDNGRTRSSEKFSDRTLDIDILTYGNLTGRHECVELPRDEIEKYAFVIRPLADIAGEDPCPGNDKSFGEMWVAFDQQSQPLTPVKIPGLDQYR